jgi:HSP20 family protein
MLATRWQPFNDVWSEVNRLSEEMNRVFGRYGFREGPGRMAPAYPALDLWQDDDNLYIEAELPGMKLDDLEIYVSGDNQLGLKGSRNVPEQEKAAWHRRERTYGEFTRAVSLPCPVDADKVHATLKHGVLTVTLPKVEETKPRRIEVKAE